MLTRKKMEDFNKVLEEINKKIGSIQSDMESRLRRLENNVADVPVATPLSFRIADNSPQLETTECFSKIKPPTYDGQTSWKCFKTQFEVVALGNRWNSSEKAINLAASLRGSATEVLQSLPLEQSLDYERLIHALTLRFGDDILQPYHVVKLKNRRQKRDETLQELAADVERLARLAFPDCPRHVQDLLAHQNFVDAIEDPECQQSVRMSEAKTLQEALIHALKFEAARDATRGYQKVVRVVKTDESQKDGDIKEAISQLQRTVEEMKKSMSFSESAPGTYRQRTYRPNAKTICWNCGKPGHIRANCRVRQAPSERGNTIPKYSGNENLASLTGPGLAMRCDDASGKIIRVSSLQGGSNELATEGLVNGLPCRMVIDSGTNVTLLRVDLAQRMESISRRIPVSNELVLQTATGEQAKVYGQVVLKFQIGNNLFSHLGYLADIKDDCLIGLDVLRKFGFSIDFQENVLKIAGEEIPLVCSRSSATNKVLKVILKSDVKIPPRSECILEGRLTASLGVPQLLIVEENGQEFGQKGLLLARTLCKSDQSHLQELLEGTREGLNWIQQKKLEHLLCQYEDVFATSPKDVGRTNVTQHRIDTGGATPVKQLPRRLPMTRRDEVAKLIEEMAEQDVIEPSSSPWASPVVLVKKKDGSTRFCVDYRRLNDLTKKDSYPLPRIDATLDTLSGSQWFSTLDLKSGYWQVSIHPEDREKTAFTTGNGLWQFKVMPFGLCNAPATFERLMETVLQGIPLETCLVYLDDIIVMGKSFEEHLINLERVLQKIRGARLKLNPRKCKPFKEKVRYLGHVISRQGIQTDPDRTETVRQWPVPRDVHQLRSFLGLCSYYRRFVPGFSNIARPLHRLTESGRPFSWTIDCERAMDKLKQALSSPPMLAYPDPGEPFILDTDASNTGIGAVLSQTQDGVERVIAYFKLLAIVKSIEHFHHYLYGQKFLLRTDHAALRWLLNFKSPEGQLARWIQRLQEYDMEIQHRKGKSHGNADALSRRPCPVNCKHCSKAETQAELNIRQLSLAEELKLDEWSPEEMRKSQFEDADLRPVMNWLNAGTNRPAWEDVASCSPITKSYWSLWDSLEFRGGVLYRKWESDDGQHIEWKMILPQSRVPSVLKELHNSPSGGHFGIAKTLGKVKERFYWAGCRASVEKWVRQCTECASRKGPKTRSRARLKTYNVGAPVERIAIDIMGPLPRSDKGNRYILVATDYFTKWPEAFPLADQEAETVAETLISQFFSRFGVPMQIHTDQGRNFESRLFAQMCKLLGSHKTRTTPLHPQSDGMVERFNRTLASQLSLFVAQNQRDWDSQLPILLMVYRSSVHETTGYSPAKMLFGRELKLPCDLIFGCPNSIGEGSNEFVDRLHSRLEKVHRWAREKLEIASEAMKVRYDTHACGNDLQEGGLVWLYNPKRKKGLSPKLQKSWEGPFRIVNKLNDVVFRIQRSSHSKPKVVHFNRLAPFKEPLISAAGENRAQKVRRYSEAYIQDVLYLCQVVNPRMDDERKLGHLMKGVAEDIYQILLAKDVEITGNYSPPILPKSQQWRTPDDRPLSFHWGRPGHIARDCRERRQVFADARARMEPRRPTTLGDYMPNIDEIEPRIPPARQPRSASPYPGRRICTGRRPSRSPAREELCPVDTVCTLEDSTIPPNSIKQITVVCSNVAGVQEVLITCSKALILDKEIIIPASVLSLNHGRSKVWMANRSDFAKIIPAGMKATEISLIDTSHLCCIDGGNDDFEENKNRCTEDLDKLFTLIDTDISNEDRIEVHEADREKTAFVTPDGLFEFKVMPFGLCNAPATFERIMDNLLRGLNWTICLCYLDDIIVFSKTMDEHLQRLGIVLGCFSKLANLKDPSGRLARLALRLQEYEVTPEFWGLLKCMAGHAEDFTGRFYSEVFAIMSDIEETVNDLSSRKIGIYLLGRFPLTRDGNRWVIVCTDYLTKYSITKAIPTGGAVEVLARLHTLRTQDIDQARYDARHKPFHYNVGDLVWIFTPVQKVGDIIELGAIDFGFGSNSLKCFYYQSDRSQELKVTNKFGSSVFNAELDAISLALEHIDKETPHKLVFFTDSPSAIQAVKYS
ncbi:K02A2.6-like [Cordylochernes scorpioides]|uniref:RNA-directed DNA polymerase n=1 Tax=Cordylochernes scorpioides TaxID=51811 RepID=A0ABY6KT61_9ARAC|nr:K02A2.6-like [Cordylochernes scorpioides]